MVFHPYNEKELQEIAEEALVYHIAELDEETILILRK